LRKTSWNSAPQKTKPLIFLFFSLYPDKLKKFLDLQFPIVLQNIVGGAWECRFSPNRKKRFPVSSYFLAALNVHQKIVLNGKIRKRTHTPVLKEVEKLRASFHVPWLDSKSVEIIWTV
jgi:hypothetical protein